MIKLFENEVQKIMRSDYFSVVSGRNAVVLPVQAEKTA